ADHVERAGDRAAVLQREDQQQTVRHPLAEEGKTGAGEVGMAPFAGAGVLVEDPEGVPMLLAYGVAGEVDDLQLLDGAGALLADRLAVARGQSGEEFVEAPIALIEPVELAVGAE